MNRKEFIFNFKKIESLHAKENGFYPTRVNNYTMDHTGFAVNMTFPHFPIEMQVLSCNKDILGYKGLQDSYFKALKNESILKNLTNQKFKRAMIFLFKIATEYKIKEINKIMIKWLDNKKIDFFEIDHQHIYVSISAIQANNKKHPFEYVFKTNFQEMKQIKDLYKNYELELIVQSENEQLNFLAPHFRRILEKNIPFGLPLEI